MIEIPIKLKSQVDLPVLEIDPNEVAVVHFVSVRGDEPLPDYVDADYLYWTDVLPDAKVYVKWSGGRFALASPEMSHCMSFHIERFPYPIRLIGVRENGDHIYERTDV